MQPPIGTPGAPWFSRPATRDFAGLAEAERAALALADSDALAWIIPLASGFRVASQGDVCDAGHPAYMAFPCACAMRAGPSRVFYFL